MSNRLDPLRGMLAKSLAVNGVLPDIGAVSTPTCSTTIRAGLLKAWAHDARDPGETLCSWLTEGAPAGLTVGFEQLDGLFPRVKPGERDDPETLTTDHDIFVNYSGVEDDEDVHAMIEGFVNKKYLKRLSSLQQVKRYVGGDSAVSKLGAVVKTVKNPKTCEERKKIRLILDNKQSGVTATAARTHIAAHSPGQHMQFGAPWGSWSPRNGALQAMKKWNFSLPTFLTPSGWCRCIPVNGATL